MGNKKMFFFFLIHFSRNIKIVQLQTVIVFVSFLDKLETFGSSKLKKKGMSKKKQKWKKKYNLFS